MSPQARMERMVSFRLPEDEYLELKRLCESVHAKSISDVARSAMHQVLKDGSVSIPITLEGKVLELEERVASLYAEVERLQNEFPVNNHASNGNDHR